MSVPPLLEPAEVDRLIDDLARWPLGEWREAVRESLENIAAARVLATMPGLRAEDCDAAREAFEAGRFGAPQDVD